MPSKIQTTVHLSVMAQEVKDDLAPIYGLKNILSAGLVLFSHLDAEQQKNIIRVANDGNGNFDASAALHEALKREGKQKKQPRPPKAG